MKRIIAILAAALTVSLTACSNTDSNSTENTNSNFPSSTNSTSSESSSAPTSSTDNFSEQGSQSESSDAPDNNESGSNILIAYFTAAENSGVDAVASASYSMVNGEPVGRLRAIANMIQSETGGDIFSIQTSIVYPADIGELIDYAADEQREDARPELRACLVSRHAHLTCIFSATLRQFFLKYIQYSCEKLPSFGEKSAARSARAEILNRLLQVILTTSTNTIRSS